MEHIIFSLVFVLSVTVPTDFIHRFFRPSWNPPTLWTKCMKLPHSFCHKWRMKEFQVIHWHSKLLRTYCLVWFLFHPQYKSCHLKNLRSTMLKDSLHLPLCQLSSRFCDSWRHLTSNFVMHSGQEPLNAWLICQKRGKTISSLELVIGWLRISTSALRHILSCVPEVLSDLYSRADHFHSLPVQQQLCHEIVCFPQFLHANSWTVRKHCGLIWPQCFLKNSSQFFYESYHHFDAMLSELVKALLSKHYVYRGA